MSKRRQHSPTFKAKVILQGLSGEKAPSEACREYKLNINVLNRWRKELVEQAHQIFARGGVDP